MLTFFRTLFIFHKEALSRSLKIFSKAPIASTLTSGTIGLVLALPTLLWVISNNVQLLTAHWHQNGHITLYLKPQLNPIEAQDFLSTVQKTPGIQTATLKTPEEGLDELKQQDSMGALIETLGENPLPFVIEAIPKEAANAALLIQKLKNYAPVDLAKADDAWIRRLQALVHFSGLCAQALMIFLACAVVLIVGNTLRLSLADRAEEIQVLQRIGATERFILRPFLYAGLLYGFLGALLAILLVHIGLLGLSQAANQVADVYNMRYTIAWLTTKQILLLFAFSLILGWLGSRCSLKRQLRLLK